MGSECPSCEMPAARLFDRRLPTQRQPESLPQAVSGCPHSFPSLCHADFAKYLLSDAQRVPQRVFRPCAADTHHLYLYDDGVRHVQNDGGREKCRRCGGGLRPFRAVVPHTRCLAAAAFPPAAGNQSERCGRADEQGRFHVCAGNSAELPARCGDGAASADAASD